MSDNSPSKEADDDPDNRVRRIVREELDALLNPKPAPTSPDEKLLSQREACQLVGIGTETLNKWRRNGWLVGYKQRELLASGQLDSATVRRQTNKVYFKQADVLKAKLTAGRNKGNKALNPPTLPKLTGLS